MDTGFQPMPCQEAIWARLVARHQIAASMPFYVARVGVADTRQIAMTAKNVHFNSDEFAVSDEFSYPR